MTMSAPNRSQTWINCIAVSINGKFIAGSLFWGRVCVWDASTGIIVAGPLDLIANAGGQLSNKYNSCEDKWEFVSSVVFSHDGRYLASGLSHGGIHIWEVACQQEGEIAAMRMLLQRHTEFISAL